MLPSRVNIDIFDSVGVNYYFTMCDLNIMWEGKGEEVKLAGGFNNWQGEIMEKIEREGSAVVRRPPFLVAGDRNYLWQNSSSRLSLFPFGVGKAKKETKESQPCT